MSGPLAPGSLARITRNVPDLSGGRSYRVGEQFIIDTYITAEESEDGVPFYWGNSSQGMNDVCVAADDVEQVMDPAATARRRPPSKQAVLRALSRSMLGDSDEFDVDESGVEDEGPGTVNFYGTTQEGLRFAVTVAVLSSVEADW